MIHLKNQRGALDMILIGVIVILLGIGGYVYYRSHHKKATPAQTPVTQPAKATTPAPSSSATTYVAGAACQSAQLTLALSKDLGSVANQPAVYFSLTNSSKVTCTLKGYPIVKLLDSTGKTIPVTVSNGNAYQINDPGSSSVSLVSGAKAYFGFGWSSLDPNSNPLPGGCVSATTIGSTAPGTNSALATTASLSNVCGKVVSVTAIAGASAFTPTSPN